MHLRVICLQQGNKHFTFRFKTNKTNYKKHICCFLSATYRKIRSVLALPIHSSLNGIVQQVNSTEK